MDSFVIEGGVPLTGEVLISGAKNSVLPILAATLLADGPCRITNVPDLRDVRTMLKVLETLGCKYQTVKPGELIVDASGVDRVEAPYELVKTMRASFIVLGPLLARFGRARVSLPGGCSIGVRQVDLHLKGFEALGATIEVREGYISASSNQLRGREIYLDFPSVGATENLMLAATMARGVTVIKNPAMEPEIVDLGEFLIRMGAKIRGHGTTLIEIEGVDRLHPADHRVIPDRIETGTFAIAAAITRGHIRIVDAPIKDIEAVLAKLVETGASVLSSGNVLEVKGPDVIRPITLSTQPFPGFPTDLQAPFMAYLSLASGASAVNERIFENRFLHVAELNRMGADIRVQNAHGAVIHGVAGLSGAQVMASDLRAGAALVLAALAARGRSVIARIYHVDRGYDQMEQKLRNLGARIERLSSKSGSETDLGTAEAVG